MFSTLTAWLKALFQPTPAQPAIVWQDSWSDFLAQTVAFYRVLSDRDKLLFEQRVALFLGTTHVDAGDAEITDEDRLLVAASAIIPVWGFPKWHYFNLKVVYLLPSPFNDRFECGQADSMFTGMVGSGPMHGRMALCKPSLYQGFLNSKDKHNVGIHEFVHLIDMLDGECDGYPERLKEYAFSIPWFELVRHKTKTIEQGNSNIPDYAAFNRAEFLSVASEYFFERPAMMKDRHPQLFEALSTIYQQDVLHIADDIKPRKKALCPCGSGKRYKRCCMPVD